MEPLRNIHPGEVVAEEFLSPLKISVEKLAHDIDLPQVDIIEIIKGKRRITAHTALRLSKYFGNSAKFWLGLQDDFDLEEQMNLKSSIINSIKTLKQSA